MIRLTLQPRDGGTEFSDVEIDCATLNGTPTADQMREVAHCIAANYGGGTVRVYDGADICILTADEEQWTLGYMEDLESPPPGRPVYGKPIPRGWVPA